MQSQSKLNNDLNLTEKVSLLISSGLGSGFSPKASGTVASAFFVLIFIATVLGGLNSSTSQIIFFLILLAVSLPTTKISLRNKILEKYSRKKISLSATKHSATKHSETKHDDPSYVVIDEWLGMHLPLLACINLDPIKIFIAFLLFRIFDVIKPWPISRLEKFNKEWGVIADDLGAGFIALAILLALY